jgi:glycosyltransferase involved in cell wall biosynthesis
VNVWLITVGEPLPLDAGDARLYRTGQVARLLAEKGHQVLWWTSAFDHVAKKQRCDRDKKCTIKPGYDIYMLHSLSYPANVSIRRIINHYTIGRKFAGLAEQETKPDIILVSLPTLELADQAVKYARKYGIPVIVDIRDLWPDIFPDLLPANLRWLGKKMLYPFARLTASACAGATGIIGVTPDFVEWGQKYAGRSGGAFDRDFPLGYTSRIPSAESLAVAQQQWATKGVNFTAESFDICFFGIFGRQLDMETVIEAAKILEDEGTRNFRFIICGTGDNLAAYKDKASSADNIVFPGWVGAAEIWHLMRAVKAGIAPYNSTPDYEMSIPNKIIEYLSAGLPIVTSLHGTTGRLLAGNACGVVYPKGDPQRLAGILRDLYDDRPKLAAMAQSAARLYNEKFVAEKVYADLIDHLELVARKALS